MYTRSSTTGRNQRKGTPFIREGESYLEEESGGEEGQDEGILRGNDPDVSDGEHKDSDDEAAESDGDGSSVGSGGFNAFGLDLSDFIDLTDHLFCRAIMSRKDPLSKRAVPCVCGSLISKCNRRGHGKKRSEAITRGAEGFYPMMPGRGGTVDGRLDKGPPIPTTEFAKLQQLAEEELEKATAHFHDTAEENDDSGEEAETERDFSQEERRGVGWIKTSASTSTGSRVQFGPDEPQTRDSRHRTPLTRQVPQRSSPSAMKQRGPPEERRPWFGLITLTGHRVICQTAEEMIDLQDEGAEFECTFPSKHLAEVWLDCPPPEARKEPQMWFGLIETDGAKVICCAQEDLEFCLTAGATLKKTFSAERAAEKWLEERDTPPPTRSTVKRSATSHSPPTPMTTGIRRSTGHPTPVRDAMDPGDERPLRHPVTPPLLPRGGLATAMGSDPSTGDRKKIYEIVMADTEAMDEALCPPGLAYEDRECLFEQMIDVGALPGTYRRGDSDGDSGVSADMQMFATVAMRSWGGKGRGNGNASNLTWASASKNALDKIKGLEDIERVISKVASIRERLFTGQEQRLARFLHRRRYLQEDIEAYLENGLLPLLVTRTFRSYSELLSMARLEAYQCTTGWNGSLAKAMVTHHAEKLGEIRAYAADWRDCLLETYVYLRDAEKNKFFAESMTRALWRQGPTQQWMKAPPTDDEPEPRSASGPGEDDGRCAHCRRRAVHEGTSKSKCPLKSFTGTGARALLKSFSDAKAKQVIASAVQALEKDRDADPKTLIPIIRAAHGKTD